MDTDSLLLKKIKNNLKNTKVINMNDIINEKITNTDTNNDTENDYEDQYEYEGMGDLIELVKKYVILDDNNRNIDKIIKDKIKNEKQEIVKLKKEKKALNDKILIHLEKMGEGQIIMDNGKLIKNCYVKDALIEMDMIIRALDENKIDSNKIKNNIINSIEKQKKDMGTKRVQLKRTFNKKK